MVGKVGMSDTPLLIVEGLVQNRLSLTLTQLSSYPAEAQVADVSQLVPKREGQALRLKALLAAAHPLPEAKYLTLHSADGSFSASIALTEIQDRALLVYQKNGKGLPDTLGVRFVFSFPNLMILAPTSGVWAVLKWRRLLDATPGRRLRRSSR
jgi:DMSO/TMAO reductase YedYZ molybdopterin-dependent catalytic subunit